MKKKFTTVQKLIPLANIKPNKWNPNVQLPQIYNSLKKNITDNGFTSPILVRTIVEEQEWEIIDGEHRWKACIELGYDAIKSEDIGVISDSLAKALTLALNNIRGQDDVLKRAVILKSLNEGQLSILPWNPDEIKTELELVDFDWDKFNQEEKIEEKKDHSITFILTKPEYLVVKHALELTKKDQNKGLLVLVEEYLSLRIDTSKYKDVFTF